MGTAMSEDTTELVRADRRAMRRLGALLLAWTAVLVSGSIYLVAACWAEGLPK